MEECQRNHFTEDKMEGGQHKRHGCGKRKTPEKQTSWEKLNIYNFSRESVGFCRSSSIVQEWHTHTHTLSTRNTYRALDATLLTSTEDERRRWTKAIAFCARLPPASTERKSFIKDKHNRFENYPNVIWCRRWRQRLWQRHCCSMWLKVRWETCQWNSKRWLHCARWWLFMLS